MVKCITISGMHGSGKSTIARMLAHKFGLKYLSIGDIFRKMARERNMTMIEFTELSEIDTSIDKQLDDMIKNEALNDNIVIDGQLAGWFCKDIDCIRIFFSAHEDVRIKRIYDRDNEQFTEKTLQEVTIELRTREESQHKRFLKKYGFDMNDMSPYNLKINTENLSIDEIIDQLCPVLETYFNSEKCKYAI